MPTPLRARIALLILLGALLIPVGVSSLRGLTHVVTCEASVETPFTIVVEDDGDATVVSSRLLERAVEAATRGCGDLHIELAAAARSSDGLDLIVRITNRDAAPWQGTVALDLDGTIVPVSIGVIDPGATGVDTVTFRLPDGTHELEGRLLLGP